MQYSHASLLMQSRLAIVISVLPSDDFSNPACVNVLSLPTLDVLFLVLGCELQCVMLVALLCERESRHHVHQQFAGLRGCLLSEGLMYLR